MIKKLTLSLILASSLFGDDLYDFTPAAPVVSQKDENKVPVTQAVEQAPVIADKKKDATPTRKITERDRFIKELIKIASLYHIEISVADRSPLYNGEKQYFVKEYPVSDFENRVSDKDLEFFVYDLIDKKISLCKQEARKEATTLQNRAYPSKKDVSCLISPRDERLVRNYVKDIDAQALLEADIKNAPAIRQPNVSSVSTVEVTPTRVVEQKQAQAEEKVSEGKIKQPKEKIQPLLPIEIELKH